MFTWLVDPWCFEPGPSTPSSSSVRGVPSSSSQLAVMSRPGTPIESTDDGGSDTSQKRKKGRPPTKTNEARRTGMDRSVYAAINGPGCIRAPILVHLGEKYMIPKSPIASCCIRCSDAAGVEREPEYCRLVRLKHCHRDRGRAVKIATNALDTWLADTAKTFFAAYPGAIYAEPDLSMPKDVKMLLAKAVQDVKTFEELAELVEHKWAFFGEFGRDILKLLLRLTTDGTVMPLELLQPVGGESIGYLLDKFGFGIPVDRLADWSAGAPNTNLRLERVQPVQIALRTQQTTTGNGPAVRPKERTKRKRTLWGSRDKAGRAKKVAKGSVRQPLAESTPLLCSDLSACRYTLVKPDSTIN
ncbi:MAG: hypothetical protein M1829_002578, partial [Trizodia sp. TS-e1964]